MELILSLSLEKRLLWLDVSFVRDRLTELRAELELEGFLSEQDFRMEGKEPFVGVLFFVSRFSRYSRMLEIWFLYYWIDLENLRIGESCNISSRRFSSS